MEIESWISREKFKMSRFGGFCRIRPLSSIGISVHNSLFDKTYATRCD